MNGRREDQLPTADSEREYLAMLKEHSYAKQSVQSLQSSRCTSSLGYATDSTELLPIECPVSRIRSPSCISSDLEDQGSHHYITSSGRSHSGGTTPNKSSPERFLLIDSDNESDFEGTAPIHNSNQNNCSSTQCSLHCSQYRGVPHRGKQLAGGVVGCEGRRRVYSSSSVDESGGAADVLPAFGLKHRNVKTTRLCYYAKTTSPSSRKPSSLLVSISFSSLPNDTVFAPPTSIFFNKLRKPTALSHFATKKRALSQTPSVDKYTSPLSPSTSPASPGVGKKPESNGSAPKGSGRIGRPPKKVARGRQKICTATQHQSDNDIFPTVETELSTNGAVLDQLLMECEIERRPSVSEDDMTSIASSSNTTSSSSANSFAKTTRSHQKQRGGKKGVRASQNNLLRVNSNFSLESLFSYCPPTLTVRNGELVPEKSLSIKRLDRFSLPSSHPIDRWSLGQPVRGRWAGSGVGPKAKRPRKNMSHPNSKV